MISIAFDILKFVEKLKASGVSDVEAKPIAEAFRDAQRQRSRAHEIKPTASSTWRW